MAFEVYIARMGCGMGICAILEVYANNRYAALDVINELPEECQECIRLNEEEREKNGPEEEENWEVFA